jgi:polyhydroxyalkanoate synthase
MAVQRRPTKSGRPRTRKSAARSSDAGTPTPSSTEPSAVGSGASLLSPLGPIARATWKLSGGLAQAVLGQSPIELSPKDPRFADPAWRDNWAYRRLGQSYLTFCQAVDELAESNPDWRKRERAKFLGGVLTSMLAPNNTLLGNPAALKRAFETGGASLLAGTRNLVRDVIRNNGMPSQVPSGAFKVGETLAATPGAVVFRNEMVELIQYRPTTPEVSERPTLLIVPPIGKYYFMDLAPGRSFVEYAVARGVTMFVTSWRNPTAEHRDWGLDEYVQTCLDSVDAVCDIAGTDDLNLIGMCAGGILASLMLNVMAARGDERVHSATFGVMLLDFGHASPIGAFNEPRLLTMSRRRSEAKGILPANDLSRVFAWMRPNDLVWNYWWNNYLMGKDPPAFDILAWSVDATNLPARLHSQFLDIFQRNPLPGRNQMQVLGEPVNLRQIEIETLVTGALTDHLTPWKGCYRATQILGGPSTFILSNAGHIASLVNPPGNPKATYWLGPEPGRDPDAWLEKAHKHTGTWWDVWAEWTLARSGCQRPARARLGSERFPAGAAAPGEYVLERA